MAIFDKIGSMAKNVTEKVTEKATDTIEITKLNSKISEESKLVTFGMEKLGEVFFQKYLSGEELSEEIKEICENIKLSKAKILEAHEEIKKIKLAEHPGEVHSNQNENGEFVFCSTCGTRNPAGTNFCSTCGSKLK